MLQVVPSAVPGKVVPVPMVPLPLPVPPARPPSPPDNKEAEQAAAAG
jgi:hypothetical protein